MCRPSTTRHKVSGIDSIRPTGPHSQPQNIAEMTTETGESPVLWPYSERLDHLAHARLDHQEQPRALDHHRPARDRPRRRERAGTAAPPNAPT